MKKKDKKAKKKKTQKKWLFRLRGFLFRWLSSSLSCHPGYRSCPTGVTTQLQPSLGARWCANIRRVYNYHHATLHAAGRTASGPRGRASAELRLDPLLESILHHRCVR